MSEPVRTTAVVLAVRREIASMTVAQSCKHIIDRFTEHAAKLEIEADAYNEMFQKQCAATDKAVNERMEADQKLAERDSYAVHAQKAIYKASPTIQAVLLRLPATGYESMKDDLRGVLATLGEAISGDIPAESQPACPKCGARVESIGNPCPAKCVDRTSTPTWRFEKLRTRVVVRNVDGTGPLFIIEGGYQPEAVAALETAFGTHQSGTPNG